MSKSIKVLFVCLGNICRSPAAEAVFRKLVELHQLENIIAVDSAGIAGHHEGEEADPRTIHHAKVRGFQVTSISRPFKAHADFESFDYIVTMDNSNYEDLLNFDREKKYLHKIYKMTQFCITLAVKEVPDPYYGGSEGFEHVMDILEDACQGLFEKIRMDYKV